MLVAYLSSQTNWPVRDKFSRLMQMATILNFETVRQLVSIAYSCVLDGHNSILETVSWFYSELN